MKTFKSLFFVAIMASFSQASFANDASGPNTPGTIVKQALSSIDLNDLHPNVKSVYVDIMITENDEIIMLGSSAKELNESLKSIINYKAVNTTGLEKMHKYTIKANITKV